MSKCVMRIAGMAMDNAPSEFDNTYVVEYDPTRPGKSPSGKDLIAHLVVTHDKSKALVLEFVDAFELFRKQHGTRIDGKPNRPLTAFHIAFDNAPGEGL